jgi:hypothetical protein
MVDQNDDPITPPVIIPDSNYHIQTRSTVTIRGYVTPYGLYSGSIPVRIKVDDGNTIRYLDVETNSDGYYSTEFTFNAVGLYTFTTYVGSDYSNSTTVYCYLGSLIDFTSLPAAFDNENYTLAGVLTYEGRPLPSQSVKIYEGQTLVDTLTTDEYGAFSKTFSNIAHGNHSFKAVFEGIENGGNTIESCDSTFNVDVYTPMILTLDGSELYNKVSGNPLIGNNMIIDYGDGTRISYDGGDYDHTYVNGVYTIKIGGVTSLADSCFAACDEITSINIPDSVTSLGNECFAGCGALTMVNIPSSVTSIGTYCFDGCDALSKIIVNWTGNSIVTYNASWFYHNTISKFYIPMGTTNDYIAKGYPSSKLVESTTLTVTSDKNIIMTGETATITATLEDNGVPVSGETVTFEVRKQSDDSLIETLTDVTDSNGVATVSYLGQGTGDIYIKADCMILSEIYVIEDCYVSDDATSDKGYWVKSGAGTLTSTFTNNGLEVSVSNTDAYYKMNTGFPLNFIVECKITDILRVSGYMGEVMVNGICLQNNNNELYLYDTSNWGGHSTYAGTISINDIVKFVCDGSNVSVYLNNNLIGTKTKNSNYNGFYIKGCCNRGITVKDIKIKPL